MNACYTTVTPTSLEWLRRILGCSCGMLGILVHLMRNSLIDSAPNTDSMFGTKENDGSQPGFAMLQCTRDIKSSSCRSCLDTLTENMEKCCQKKRGWRLLSPSCFIRYEEPPFYRQTPAPLPPHVPAAPQPTPIDEG
ncbi:hypothetical protein LWI29_008733 [Acer saccharum]|uniref:Gnk2-homologous domain-containing protein n=1 Tax=Acer saccharum TaxID=4024 RepID=A0AA39RQI9_ACESA|nr:hypothetical protein LWI29_008733 [Acer saccharum]